MGMFINLLLNNVMHILVQWIEIWKIRRPNFVGDVVVQIISYPLLLLKDFEFV